MIVMWGDFMAADRGVVASVPTWENAAERRRLDELFFASNGIASKEGRRLEAISDEPVWISIVRRVYDGEILFWMYDVGVETLLNKDAKKGGLAGLVEVEITEQKKFYAGRRNWKNSHPEVELVEYLGVPVRYTKV